MLLPSALPCDSARARFPNTHIFPATPLSPTSDDSFIASNGLTRACRALQSFATPPPSSMRRSKPRLLSPFEPRPLSATKPNKVTKAPRGENKRRRHQCQYESEEEEDEDDSTPSWMRERDPYKTPKRQCRVPPNMPMRMKPEDFEALETPRDTRSTARRTRNERRRMPRRAPMIYKPVPQPIAEINPSTTPLEPSQSCDTPTEEWTGDDDDRLVNLVLEKLSLSKEEWNECAQAMGKNCDSIGRRWNMLVGEGHVGMRRGGRMTRPKIHESWR